MASLLDTIDRFQLTDLPTPLHEAPRLARTIGLRKLFIKRDDLTGLAMGGNKARKLEYEFARILKERSDVVVTIGGVQSNHTRMTAAAARKAGIDVKIVLGGPEIRELKGNVLLDVLFGAEIRLLKDNDSNEDLAAAMDEWVRELREKGRTPYALPIGGSTGLGALGYVRAMRELAGQLPPGPAQIVLAVGSCGTLAGAVLGARMFMPQARVMGISVSRTSSDIAVRTVELIEESARLVKTDITVVKEAVEVYDRYHRAYGVMTDSGKEAMLLCAHLEGILLDPVYTGKAMAGLIDLSRRGVLDVEMQTVFIHTGGLPGLFAYEHEFRDLAQCTPLVHTDRH